MNTDTNYTTNAGYDNNHGNMERHGFLRDMLSSSLKTIDERWHQVVDLSDKVKDNPVPFILAGSGVILAAAGGITYAVLHSRRQASFPRIMVKGLRALLKKYW